MKAGQPLTLSAGESLGVHYYTLGFGTAGQGTDGLSGTGLQEDNVFGNGIDLRLFDGAATQAGGTYDIAYKGTYGTDQISRTLPTVIPQLGSALSGGGIFDGTAAWIGHSRFRRGQGPAVGSTSPPTAGIRWNGSSGPADTGSCVRIEDARLVDIPVTQNVLTQQSFVVSAQIYVPSHSGVTSYRLRPQPFVERGSFGLTSPGGTGDAQLDLGGVLDRWNLVQIRADFITNGGTLAASSDDTGGVTYTYFLNGTQVASPTTMPLDPTWLTQTTGPVQFGPAFGVGYGWTLDAPELFVDSLSLDQVNRASPIHPGEVRGTPYYALTFGTAAQGADGLAGTGLQEHGVFGNGVDLRFFDGSATQASGAYEIAYKSTYGTDQINGKLPISVPRVGGALFGGGSFDGTAAWVGHSRFRSGQGPAIGSSSPPTTGVRWNGTTGAADGGSCVRIEDARLINIPVTQNAITQQSFLVSAQLFVPSHSGVARYLVRPQPFVERGSYGLTSPGGMGLAQIDLSGALDRWNLLEIRADFITNGGTSAASSDDTGSVTYTYFLNGAQVASPATLALDPNWLTTTSGPVQFGPALGLAYGWSGDAPELFLDNLVVSSVQAQYRTSWLGETISASDAAQPSNSYFDLTGSRWVQATINAIWVDPVADSSGNVKIFTNSSWDEATRPMGVYRYEPGTSSGVLRPFARLQAWGNAGGSAVTGDGTYVYASMPKITGSAQDRSCVRRYKKTDVVSDGYVASTPFPSGGDTDGDVCLSETVNGGSANPLKAIVGLAVSSQFLFVSNARSNAIVVYPVGGGAAVQTITINGPRGIAYGTNGSLWAILAPTGTQTTPTVQEYIVGTTGGLTPARQLPGITVTSVATDSSGHLYVTNDAPAAQQVNVFDTTQASLPEVPSMRLGDAGGTLAASGNYGDAKLDGPIAVGTDASGNYYVASDSSGSHWYGQLGHSVTDLRRFNPTGLLQSSVMSYPTEDMVVPDPANPNMVYSAGYAYKLNLDQPAVSATPGTEWDPSRTARTIDRFACPYDGRIWSQNQNAPIAIRNLGSPPRRYLYMTGNWDYALGIYRFDTTSSIARPSVLAGANESTWPPAQNGSVWTDKNGKCDFSSDEFTSPTTTFQGSNSWSVAEADNLPNHRQGDLWAAHGPVNPALPPSPIARIRFTGLDAAANPTYDFTNWESLGIPAPFAEVMRIYFISATDTLYAIGRDRREAPSSTSWLVGGWLLARYDGFYQHNGAVSPTWVTPLPDDVLDCGQSCYPSNLFVAGDRAYVGEMGTPGGQWLEGRIWSFNSSTGARDLTLLRGPEVSRRSGWLDISAHAISAIQTTSGKRFVFAEEQFYGRTLIYRDF